MQPVHGMFAIVEQLDHQAAVEGGRFPEPHVICRCGKHRKDERFAQFMGEAAGNDQVDEEVKIDHRMSPGEGRAVAKHEPRTVLAGQFQCAVYGFGQFAGREGAGINGLDDGQFGVVSGAPGHVVNLPQPLREFTYISEPSNA